MLRICYTCFIFVNVKEHRCKSTTFLSYSDPIEKPNYFENMKMFMDFFVIADESRCPY